MGAIYTNPSHLTMLTQYQTMSDQCQINVRPMSDQCQTIVGPMSDHCRYMTLSVHHIMPIHYIVAANLLLCTRDRLVK